jgi:hypothetical protein
LDLFTIVTRLGFYLLHGLVLWMAEPARRADA